MWRLRPVCSLNGRKGCRSCVIWHIHLKRYLAEMAQSSVAYEGVPYLLTIWEEPRIDLPNGTNAKDILPGVTKVNYVKISISG